jgi:branched-chain amino acid transport system permease protein
MVSWVHAEANASSALAIPAWRLGRHRLLVVLAVVGVALPLVAGNGYFYDVAILVAFNAVVCVGLNLLIGYAGQVSLGHAAFFGLGGYGTALLASRYAWPSLVALAAAVVGVALLAFLVARPILRLRGHYLAMATLGLGIIVSIVLATEDRITGGPDGLQVPPLAIGAFAVSGELLWYAIAVGALLLAVFVASNVVDSPAGRALRALHTSEVAAQVAGIDTARYKLFAFVLSAAFAALAGALSAFHAGFITPSSASFLRSFDFVTMVVFGGMASTAGAIVGAAVLTLLPQALTSLRDYETIVFGALLMATMIFMPRGIVPTLAALARQRGAR